MSEEFNPSKEKNDENKQADLKDDVVIFDEPKSEEIGVDYREDVPESDVKKNQLEEKIKSLEERYLRLAAEYDNYKKRTIREKDAIFADCLASNIEKLLPILDNLERASKTETDSEEASKIVEGIELIAKQFKDILASMDIEIIDAVGNKFDHLLHNAVMHIEDDNFGDNEVVEELQKGYKYKDKVIRHSMVKVAN